MQVVEFLILHGANAAAVNRFVPICTATERFFAGLTDDDSFTERLLKYNPVTFPLQA